MRNILMLRAGLLLALSLTLTISTIATTKTKTNAGAKKEEAVPLRKGKKGKVEPVIAAVKKAPAPRANPMLTNLHPQAQAKLNAAMKDMQTAGICPTVTSAYRSNAEQQAMYRCARQHRCRVARGIYGARKPGTSLHEAGLAVDFAAVAVGKKNRRRLTHDGRKVVKVMQKHGFKWRYGLQDPAHFELEPRAAGFKNERHAIVTAQQREAQARLVAQKAAQKANKSKPRRRTA